MQNRGNKVSPSIVISIMELIRSGGVAGSIILEPENNDDGVVGKEKLSSDNGVVWNARDGVDGLSGGEE